MQILAGYSFLGNTGSLGEEVNSCFASAVNSGALKVVRGVVLTRAGLEDKARSTTILQEILKWLPPDLFRQCLAKASTLQQCGGRREVLCRVLERRKEGFHPFQPCLGLIGWLGARHEQTNVEQEAKGRLSTKADA